MTTLEYAQEYIRRGWSVIPIAPGTKAPPAGFPLVEYLSGPRRCQDFEATSWWDTSNEIVYDIGIVTGAPSGLIVADVDPRNGGTFDLCEKTDVVGSPVVSTRGGGRHYYYRLPSQDLRSGPTEYPGIDRKAGGGYVLAPPSPGYDWFDYSFEGSMPACPAWLLESPSSTSTEPAQPWVATTLAAPHLCPPGGQHDALIRLAWWAAGHLEYDIALGMLTSWARGLPLGGRPWTHEDVRSRLESAYAKRVPEAGRAGPLVDGPAGKGQAPPRTLEARSFKRFVEAVETEPGAEWFVTDMLAPGCWTELLGRMKEGKSTFAMGMLGAMLEGKPFLGRTTRQTKVLYLTEQAGRSFEATIRRGGLEDRDDALALTIADTYGVPWSDVAKTAVEIAKAEGCGVIVVDTLSGLAQIEDEDAASSLNYLNPLQGAKAAGVAVLFVRHSRKSGGAINVAGRGSGAITGAMDICLRLDAPDGVASSYRYLEIISRLSGVADAHLSYEGGTYVLGPSPEDRKIRARVNPVIAFLSSRGPAGATAEEVAAEINADVRTARRRITELEEDGKVISKQDSTDKRVVRYALRPAVS